jgi:hypothetical protein
LLFSVQILFYLAAAPAASGPRVVKPSSAPAGGSAAPAARPAAPSSAPAAAKKVVKSGGAAAAKKPAAGKSGSPPAALSGGIASEPDTSLEECEARAEEIFSGRENHKICILQRYPYVIKIDTGGQLKINPNFQSTFSEDNA